MAPKGTDLVNPLVKRKLSGKIDRPPEKSKVAMGSTIGETPNVIKLPHSGKGKGLITVLGPVTEKRPVLFHEDSRYALKQLSSIIKDDDYEDLGNHATEAMGEIDLFSLARVCVSIAPLPSV